MHCRGRGTQEARKRMGTARGSGRKTQEEGKEAQARQGRHTRNVRLRTGKARKHATDSRYTRCKEAHERQEGAQEMQGCIS